jgi:hypothetical protein
VVLLLLVLLSLVLLGQGFLVLVVRGLQQQRAILMPMESVGQREVGFSAIAAGRWRALASLRVVGTCRYCLVNSCFNRRVEGSGVVHAMPLSKVMVAKEGRV